MTKVIQSDYSTNKDPSKPDIRDKKCAGRKPLPLHKKRMRLSTTVSAKSYAFIQERTGGIFDSGQGRIIDWLVDCYLSAMKRHERERAERKANYGNLGFGKKKSAKGAFKALNND